jgi:hypothetical protein
VPYLWGEFANCARDLKLPDLGATFAQQSIGESARQRRARRGALSTYGLAISHLQRGEIDSACDTAQQALTLAHNVQSVRLTQALDDFSGASRHTATSPPLPHSPNAPTRTAPNQQPRPGGHARARSTTSVPHGDSRGT